MGSIDSGWGASRSTALQGCGLGKPLGKWPLCWILTVEKELVIGRLGERGFSQREQQCKPLAHDPACCFGETERRSALKVRVWDETRTTYKIGARWCELFMLWYEVWNLFQRSRKLYEGFKKRSDGTRPQFQKCQSSCSAPNEWIGSQDSKSETS